MVIFTITSLKYFPKSIILAKSAKEQMPEVKVFVCLVEEKLDPRVANCPHFEKIILAKDLGDKDFYSNIFKYNALEGITSLKAQLFLYLLEYYKDEETFIFLDTDTKIYNPFEEVHIALDKAPIIVTPHLLKEEDTQFAIEENELTTLIYGIYNTAFVAIKRSKEAKRFLTWWNSKLKNECYFDTDNGIFVDQRWIDLAICYFDIEILKHPGYNVACWNLSKRQVAKQNDRYLINNEPLRFFHFSGHTNGRLDYTLQTYVTDKDNPIYEIIETYKKEVNECEEDYFFFKNKPWSYDYFFDGSKIESSSRKRYQKNHHLIQMYENPFSKNNDYF